MVTIVGHKIGAPKGVAALYVRPGCLDEHGRQFTNNNNKIGGGGGIMLIGGGQEFGRRGGTENTPYIVGLGKAAEMAQLNLKQNAAHMERLRSRLLENLQKLLGENNIRVNGPIDPKKRLPNTLSVGLDRTRSSDLLESISSCVAASAGAACHSTGGSISSVLLAMKVPISFARGTLRLSVGPTTTIEEIDEASEIISKAAKVQWKQLDDSNSNSNSNDLAEQKIAVTQ
jgi:cysteine desulfurase